MNNNSEIFIGLILVGIVLYFVVKHSLVENKLNEKKIAQGNLLSTSTFAKSVIMNNNGNSPSSIEGSIPGPAPLLQPLPVLINTVPLIVIDKQNTKFDTMQILQQGFLDSYTKDDMIYSPFTNSSLPPVAIATSYENPMISYSTSTFAAESDPIRTNETNQTYATFN
jgi:hypothetical protein